MKQSFVDICGSACNLLCVSLSTTDNWYISYYMIFAWRWKWWKTEMQGEQNCKVVSAVSFLICIVVAFERAFSCLTFSSFKILLFKKSFLFLALLKVHCFLKVSHFGHDHFLVSLWKMTYLLSKLIQQKVNFQKWLTFQNQLFIPCRQAYFMEKSYSTKYKTCWPKEGMHLAYFWKYSIIYVIWPDQFFLIPSHIPMTQNTTDALYALPSTLDITLTLPLCQDED